MSEPRGSAGKARADAAAVDYLVVGHVTVDRLGPRRVTLGGTASYAALTARNLGARVAIHTSAGYEPGLVDTLYGTMVARIPAPYTTCFINTVDERGQRQQTIESVAEPLRYEQILTEWRNPKVVHLAPVCQEVDPSLVDRFPRSLVGVTPQGWLRRWGEDGVVRRTDWADAERVLARADAVIVAAADLPDPALEAAWAAVARLLVVTHGSAGSIVYRRDEAEPYRSAGFKSGKVVDRTGAGDVYASAFLWHLAQGRDWREAADWAGCVASFAVEKRGVAGVPKLEEIEPRWKGGQRTTGGAARV